VSSAAAALLTLGVVAALVVLHSWSSDRQLASESINSLRTLIAVEQEGVLDSARVTAAAQANANAALALIQTEGSTSALPVIDSMTNLYQRAVSAEITSMIRGDTQIAATTDMVSGDPARCSMRTHRR
jgi:hypothetical protein